MRENHKLCIAYNCLVTLLETLNTGVKLYGLSQKHTMRHKSGNSEMDLKLVTLEDLGALKRKNSTGTACWSNYSAKYHKINQRNKEIKMLF